MKTWDGSGACAADADSTGTLHDVQLDSPKAPPDLGVGRRARTSGGGRTSTGDGDGNIIATRNSITSIASVEIDPELVVGPAASHRPLPVIVYRNTLGHGVPFKS